MMKAKEKMTRIVSVMLILFVGITFTMTFDTAEASAASKPGKPGWSTCGGSSCSSVSLKWKSVKNASGYQVYMNGKSYKTTPNKSLSVNGLAPNKSYTFKVRAYRNYKQKQYYNSKSKKWQNKKPSKKNWKGKKTRKVTLKKYGSFSKNRSVKTLNHSYTVTKSPANFAQGASENGKCKYCGKTYTKVTGAAGRDAAINASARTARSSQKNFAIVVEWNGIKGATGYKVEKSTNHGSFTTCFYSSTCQYTDKSITGGNVYQYRVTPYANIDGAGYYGKSAVTAELTAVGTLPNTLGDGVALNTDNTVTLQWEEVEVSEEVLAFYGLCAEDPVYYWLEYQSGSGEWTALESSFTTETSAVFTPDPDVDNNCRIIVGYLDAEAGNYIPFDEVEPIVFDPFFYDALYTMEIGTPVNSKADTPLPQTVSGLKATASSSSAKLTWVGVPGATKYIVTRNGSSEAMDVTGTSCIVSGLSPSTTYTFTVKAVVGSEVGKGVSVTCKTLPSTKVYPVNENIYLNYQGVRIFIGQAWTSTLKSQLKSKGPGTHTISRLGKVDYNNKIYNQTVYMFDCNDYDNFLAVYVSEGQVTKWMTNGSVLGVQNGQTLYRGCVPSSSQSLATEVFKNTKQAAPYFKDMGFETDGYIIGGFANEPGGGFTAFGWKATDIDNEKKGAMHFMNALRYLCGSGKLTYNNYLDGKNYTYSGTVSYYIGTTKHTDKVTNMRYGAQPAAETLEASDMVTHDMTRCSKGPLAGIPSALRNMVIYQASGKTVSGGFENCGTGIGCAEVCIGVYNTSSGHISNILNSSLKYVGIGFGTNGRKHLEIFDR